MKKVNSVLFVGSKQLGLTCLKAVYESVPDQLLAVMTLDDSNDIRSRYGEFLSFCSDHNIKIYTANSKNHSEKIIFDLTPDMCLFVGWYWLIGEAVLNQVPFGCLGIHNSLLPKYRGSSPLVWSIMNNDKEVGFSIFSFTSEMDEGDIWYQYKTELKAEDTVKSVLERLELAAYDFFRNNFVYLLTGKMKPTPQNHKLATYCSQRTPDDGKINWSESANRVLNFIRALTNPYPGAFSYYQSKKMTVLSAEELNVVYYGSPGQVARINHQGVTVICGENTAILIKEVIFEGSICEAYEVVKSIKTRF